MTAAERREVLARLVLRHSKLSPAEIAELRQVYPLIVAAHYDLVWERLRRASLQEAEANDLFQEVFFALFNLIVAGGFPDSLEAVITTITARRLLNHLRDRARVPFTLGLPTSSAEKPTSTPDLARAVDLRALTLRALAELSPEHLDVVRLVVLASVSPADAALALGLAEGTVKSRVMAAKRDLYDLLSPLVPSSQRGST